MFWYLCTQITTKQMSDNKINVKSNILLNQIKFFFIEMFLEFIIILYNFLYCFRFYIMKSQLTTTNKGNISVDLQCM